MWANCLLIVLVFGFLERGRGYIDPAFQEGVESLQEYFTEDEILQWWYNNPDTRLKPPRTFPICFNPRLPLPAIVRRFQSVFEDVENLTVYNPLNSSWQLGRTNTPYDSMITSRIAIQRENTQGQPFGGIEGLNPFELQQWVNFVVKFSSPVQALYVQPIAGPLGIPMGEFSIEFRCTENIVDDPNYLQHANIEPCHYSPRASYTWSQVFMYDTGSTTVNQISFRYRWTEVPGHETGFVQFILIASPDLTTFHPILSPIFRFLNLDSLAAVPSPYHQYYDKITCGLGSSNALEKNVEMIDNITRILPSLPYDECVRTGKGRHDKGSTLDTCPPGFFVCTEEWKSEVEWQKLTEEWFQLVTSPEDECCELKIPLFKATTTTTTTTTTPPLCSNNECIPSRPPRQKVATVITDKVISERFLENRTLEYDLRVKITHGDFCILVWLVLTPIANHCSRFFKEFPPLSYLGLGVWIAVHMLLHSVNLIITWWSYGLVIGGGNDRLGNASATHFVLAFFCTLLQHGGFLTGLWRPELERKAFKLVLNHSIWGHVAYFLAAMQVFLSSAGPVRLGVSGALVVTFLLAFVILHFLELKQDRELGVVLHRAQCPILQQIVVYGGAPPEKWTKMTIMILFCGITLGLFVFMVVTFPASEVAVLKRV